MKNVFKKHKGFIFFSVFLVAWLTLLFFVSPIEIVEFIGVETGYLLIFLTGLIGISSLSSGSMYVILITFASTGEFHPLLLALSAAPAMALGDAIFFVFSTKGREALKEKGGELIKKITSWTSELSPNKITFLAYAYSGFTPLPQDVLMIALGLGGAPFWRVIPAVFLGNFTLITILTYLVMYG